VSRIRAVSISVWVALSAALGCGGDAKDSGSSSVSDEEAGCGDSVDAVAAGLEFPCDDAACSLVFVNLEPTVPDRGDNTWTLQVAASAASVSGLSVAPFMPAHQHGTAPADFEGAPVSTDTWTVGPFDLFMPGRWEVRVTVTFDDSTTSEAVTSFCVEG